MRLQRMMTMMALLAICVVGLNAQERKEVPLTNDDVALMVSGGLGEDMIIAAIGANEVNFDVSPNGLLALKKANVSDKIIETMLAAATQKRNAAARAAQAAPPAVTYVNAPRVGAMGVPIMNSPAAQSPTRLAKVTLILGDKKTPLRPSTTEIAQCSGKGGSTAGGILKGFGKGMVMAGSMAGGMGGAPTPRVAVGSGAPTMPGVSYTWALPGRTSALVLPGRSPEFEIEFSDIPGIDPDNYEPVIVRLIATKDNWRLVETSKDNFDKHGNDTRSTKTKNKTLVKITNLGRGHLHVTPASELVPGEYGLVLHPKKDQKEFAGVPAPNVEAIFFSVWDFSVPGTENASPGKVGKN
ncbi:MAG TPA: hypothetical protein VE398_08470 [Acidobacteriota bacterium]|nr:hypothetical protein [Acidobacteriota bacterium]